MLPQGNIIKQFKKRQKCLAKLIKKIERQTPFEYPVTTNRPQVKEKANSFTYESAMENSLYRLKDGSSYDSEMWRLPATCSAKIVYSSAAPSVTVGRLQAISASCRPRFVSVFVVLVLNWRVLLQGKRGSRGRPHLRVEWTEGMNAQNALESLAASV
jgi:hypothetical protein